MADSVNKDGSYIRIHSFNKNDEGEWVDWKHIANIDLDNFNAPSHVDFDVDTGQFFQIQLFRGAPEGENKEENVLNISGEIIGVPKTMD